METQMKDIACSPLFDCGKGMHQRRVVLRIQVADVKDDITEEIYHKVTKFVVHDQYLDTNNCITYGHGDYFDVFNYEGDPKQAFNKAFLKWSQRCYDLANETNTSINFGDAGIVFPNSDIIRAYKNLAELIGLKT